jgi:hypothetical protein
MSDDMLVILAILVPIIGAVIAGLTGDGVSVIGGLIGGVVGGILFNTSSFGRNIFLNIIFFTIVGLIVGFIIWGIYTGIENIIEKNKKEKTDNIIEGLKQKAQGGDIDAQYQLGHDFRFSLGPDEAEKWIKIAAEDTSQIQTVKPAAAAKRGQAAGTTRTSANGMTQAGVFSRW